RQLHHLAEAVVHDGKPAVGAEHAEAVWHVVERRVELACQRRLALAGHDRAHEYAVQIGREPDQHREVYGTEERHRDVKGRATQRERNHGRTEAEQSLEAEYPL